MRLVQKNATMKEKYKPQRKLDCRGALTGAVFSQVLVFALLLLSKRAAGLAALSGFAFTRRPPVVGEEIYNNLRLVVLC